MNNGYNYYRGNRRRPRKRITGRFYAFLCVVLVLVVMLVVFISTRSRQSQQAYIPPQVSTSQNTVTPSLTETPVVNAPQTQAAVDPSMQGTDESGTSADNSGSIDAINALLDEEDPPPLEGDAKVKTESDYGVYEGLSDEWRNILLLGTDARDIRKVSRSDTIMIASINVNDGRVKLVSIMRDTIVPIPGYGENKINAACRYGGPELTMQVVNQCFKMNITEYVLVNFNSFQSIVDILGGVRIDVTQEEMEMINKSLGEQAKINNMTTDEWKAIRDSEQLKTFGSNTQLTGSQALAYSRIRKIDSDYARTERQRTVMEAIMKKVKESVTVPQLVQLASAIWSNVNTNINMMSAVGLATTVLKSGIGDLQQGRIPIKDSYASETRSSHGSAFYDVDYEANAAKLHSFIYG